MAVENENESNSHDSQGLVLKNTEQIRSFLISASKNPDLVPRLQTEASGLSSQTSVPYKSLKVIYLSCPYHSRPNLLCLLNGSDFVLSTPKPREKSEELKERLKKLAELAERNAYKELVRDITPKIIEKDEYFSSYKDQIGFGLHVVLTMFTGYLVGYAAFRALFNHNPAMNAAGGILGLVCAMLIETVLFIIKTSSPSITSLSSTSKQKKRQ